MTSHTEFFKKHGIEKAKELLNNTHIESRGEFYNQLCELVESHELVESYGGLAMCNSIINSVDSDESEYGSRLGVEYKKSSDNSEDKALMFCDDRSWSESSYFNCELDNDSKFLNIKRLKQAIADVESCGGDRG